MADDSPTTPLPATRTPPVATTPSWAWPSQRRPGGLHATSRLGSGSVRLCRATRWRRMRDARTTRWRRVVRYFLATAHMLALVPLGDAECAMCVPLGGVEWCARDTARLRGHQRGRRHRRAAQRPRATGLPVKSNLWRCRAVPAVQGPYCTRAAHLVQELSFYVGITTTIRKVLVHHGRCVMERGGTKASRQG